MRDPLSAMALSGKDLKKWYGHLPSRRVDLVGDYAGNELFLVEGDSLLLQCFADPLLNFDDGFQLLHAIYSVESLLVKLVQRHCNFHIAFFHSNQELCIPETATADQRSKYLLARAVVIRHLQRHLPATHPSIKVLQFGSIQSKDFQQYLRDDGHYFMMCHDGAFPSQSLGYDASETEADETVCKDKAKAFRAMIYQFHRCGYSVGLINSVESIDTKIMTLILEGASRERSLSAATEVAEPLTSSPSPQISEALSLLCSFWARAQAENGEVQDLARLELQESNGIKNGLPTPNPKDLADFLNLDEREMVTLAVLAENLQSLPNDVDLIYNLIAQLAALKVLLLSERHLNQQARERDSRSTEFLTRFSNNCAKVISSIDWTNATAKMNVISNIADLVDGTLFFAIVDGSEGVYASEMLKYEYDRLCRMVALLTGVGSKTQQPASRSSNTADGAVETKAGSYSLLPFASPVFDKHLASVKVNVNTKSSTQSFGRIHAEVQHWHNVNRKLTTKPTKLDPKQAKRLMRRNDFFMAEMQAYAASLTNAVGKTLEPEIVTVTGLERPRQVIKEEKIVGKDSQAGKKGGKTGKLQSKKQATLADAASSKVQKDRQNTDKAFEAWRKVRSDLEAESLESLYNKLKEYLTALNNDKRVVVQAEVTFNMLAALVRLYIQQSKKRGQDLANMSLMALIWNTVREMSKMPGLTLTIRDHLRSVIELFKLPQLDILPSAEDRPLAYDPKLALKDDAQFAITTSPVEFQLMFAGPYMDRNLESAPDDRVAFEPDGWQRRVLDELDKRNSVFVVAPTSSGKTFISFYAMEQILRSDDDGVMVYVAPTKALVNQVAAEIQARFRKTFKHPGKSVWAIHTRDYRINNPTGCQVLVTVPHILQIMLLSPTNAKSWSSRVKYIIFDEIHCIGQAEDGVIWEQLLLLAPCPIIALSATIGNPDSFSSWLSATQSARGTSVSLIKHQHRYSDLRKFIYKPPSSFAFTGLSTKSDFAFLGLDGLEGFDFIHPVAALIDRTRGMPEDLSLEARDCQLLFQAMSKHQTKDFPVPNTLDPTRGALPLVIKKADVIAWERELKALLKSWMADQASPYDQVVRELSAPARGLPKDQGLSSDSEDDPMAEALETDTRSWRRTTLPLLCQLHERNALPAIIFNYERFTCDQTCRELTAQLHAAEEEFKKTSPSWQKKMADFEKWKREKEAGEKRTGKKSTKGGSSENQSKAEQMREAANKEVSPFDSFDPLQPLDGFHFAVRHKIEAADWVAIHREFKRRGLADWLIKGLQRGIGVHHAGMNRKYRQVVEMLFRKGYLRVVIATGTLALGINMPCATVVFAGDSVFLTALNYRQAAGRAGRRGFDLLGNVVFHGLSEAKIFRLISSRLPDLNGHFPITTSLILRLFTLLSESKNSRYAVQAIDSLLSQPRLYLNGPAFKDQVLHHLRFSIEYLRRQDLLSAQGTPINFAGLTSHLYFTENSSFAFNALVKGGYFHSLCADIHDKESHVLRTLMVVLAHLFHRRPCRQADTEFAQEKIKQSSSIVFLPPLPKEASRVLRNHNATTLNVFATYVRTFVEQHELPPDRTLPLTGQSFGAEDSKPPSPDSKIRSAFVALSGHNDNFATISDLCRTARSGVFLEESVIPYIQLHPEESATPLNAYLYDFFMHGDVHALEKGNGVRKSDVWFLLNDFSLVLATIVASLASFLKLPESDLNGEGLEDVTGLGDEQENVEDDNVAGGNDTESTITSASSMTDTSTAATSVASARQNGTLIAQKAKKSAAADAWDDEEGAGEGIADDWDADADADADADVNHANIKQATNGDEGTAYEKEQAPEGGWSKAELERGFLDIFKAFSKLRTEFDEKFRKIFA